MSVTSIASLSELDIACSRYSDEIVFFLNDVCHHVKLEITLEVRESTLVAFIDCYCILLGSFYRSQFLLALMDNDSS